VRKLAKRRLATIGWASGLALAVGSCAASPASAHPLAPALYELRETSGGELVVRFKRPRPPVATAAPEVRLPEGCRILQRSVGPGEAGSRIERWRLRCEPPGLAGRWLEATHLAESATDVVVRVERADGTVIRGLLRPESPRFRIPERESPLRVVVGYGRLGFEHIGSGIDHLLFVLGLVFLAGATRRLLVTVTAFTLGHSLTLALASLGLVQVAPGPVEIGIAASLLYLAAELARPGLGREGVSVPLAAAFGLLHGLGFAGALRQSGLPPGAVPLALFGFNVGIEVGQLVFVGLLLVLAGSLRAALGGARTRTLARPATLVSAYALGTTAAYLIFERVAALG